ncbi:MAG: hypothetical protein RLZZ15_1967 [Verrucomicrobiota bacterium]|jgi:hypothetical protein
MTDFTISEFIARAGDQGRPQASDAAFPRGRGLWGAGEACERRAMRALANFFRPLVALTLAWAGGARAESVADIARFHVQVMGGAKALAELQTVRMTGRVTAAGRRMTFVMYAARPASVRLEISGGGRVLVQGTDGTNPPWELDTAARPARARPMAAPAGRAFLADAEFDDPLVAGAARGFVIEDGGAAVRDGTRLLRLLVTRADALPFSLFVDPETFFVVRREEERAPAAGGVRQIVTRYADFAPVDRVLMPFRITVLADGKVEQETVVEKIEPNAVILPQMFAAPP